jgi:RNA polymerase sigma-70 factor (ECF subfamily)
MGIHQVTVLGPAAVLSPREQAERALVDRARVGDHAAFAELVENRLERTFRTVLAILGDEAEARDTTQAIFLQAWTNLPQLRDPDLFPAWFGRIVVNTARTSLRGRRRRFVREVLVSALPDEGESLTDRDAGHEEEAAAVDRLERALDRIGSDHRVLLWLHHYEGLSLAAVGDRLGIPPKTVKSRMFTARRALERELQVQDR